MNDAPAETPKLIEVANDIHIRQEMDKIAQASGNKKKSLAKSPGRKGDENTDDREAAR